jgi:hypothetical protein
MMRMLLLLIISCIVTQSAFCKIKTAVSNSSDGWAIDANWNPIGMPASGDTVIIPLNFMMKVKGKIYGSLPKIVIFIYGTLEFDPSGKLDLGSGSEIRIDNNGKISSNGTASEQITIDNVLKFDGKYDGTVTGPSYASIMTGVSPNGFSTGVVLPVKLIHFNIENKNQSAYLSWSFIQESNNNVIELQHKNADGNWQALKIAASKSNPGEIIEDEYKDIAPLTGMNYYRLRLTDNNSDVFSKIVSLKIYANTKLTTYPNPVKNILILNAGKDFRNGTVRITNSHGDLMLQKDIVADKDFELNVEKFINGIYYLTFSDGTLETTQAIIVKK